MGDVLYIVMPAYNEEANIEAVVRQWYKCLSLPGVDEKSRLVVADAGSKDKTHKILMNLQADDCPKVVALTGTGTYHGPKVIALYKYAIDSGADYIFQTDSDGQTVPEEFTSFWESRDKYDVLLGNRVVRGDGKSRKFVEIVLCKLLRIIFGVKVHDSNAPFRLMKAEVVNKYIGRFKEDYNLPNVMLTTYFSYYKEKMDYREITFKPRQGGTNSLNIPRIVKIGINAVGDFYELKKGM